MICATRVNIQTHTQTSSFRPGYMNSLASWAKNVKALNSLTEWADRQFKIVTQRTRDTVPMTTFSRPNSALLWLLYTLVAPPRWGEWSIAISLSVCLCVCLSVREHISGTAGPIFTNFLCRAPVAVARSFSGNVAVRYVLPVLWMTSRLAVVGRMAMRGRLNL